MRLHVPRPASHPEKTPSCCKEHAPACCRLVLQGAHTVVLRAQTTAGRRQGRKLQWKSVAEGARSR